MTRYNTESLDEDSGRAAIPALASILIDCVEGGASVSFLAPITAEKAAAFWQSVIDGVARGDRALIVARDPEGEVQGTVQLVLSQPENQPHRAEVAKLLVHGRARRGGIGEMLMREVERIAAVRGRTLLVLDTASADAARIYVRLGWNLCGVIPGYALYPDGTPCDTTVYWKCLPALA